MFRTKRTENSRLIMDNESYLKDSYTTIDWDTAYSEDQGGLQILCEDNLQVSGANLTVVFFFLIFILSLVGNGLVLCTILKYENLTKVTNILIINLAVSDLVFAFSLPFWAVSIYHHWIFGRSLCKILSGVYFIGFYSCMMFLTLMTVDRYLVVVHAISIAKRRRACYAWLITSIIWLISLMASIPEMLASDVLEYEEENIMCESTNETNKSTSLLGYYLQIIFFFLFPFAIFVYCYCRILKTLVTCKTKKKHKAVKLIFAIVIVFFLCWTPYNVILFIMSLQVFEFSFLKECNVLKKLNYSFYICRNLAYFHCCLNPFFYVFVGVKFRRHLKSLLYSICYGQRTRIRSLSSQNSSLRSSTLVADTTLTIFRMHSRTE
ncbi:chemokine XC receptor 1-like isoform X1 [Polypterus senegalus]